MKFLAKIKKIFNLHKLGNCFQNRSGKSDPRKETLQDKIITYGEIIMQKLETTVYELNKKIPDIEPLLKEFEKMFRTLDNISKAIGYEA